MPVFAARGSAALNKGQGFGARKNEIKNRLEIHVFNSDAYILGKSVVSHGSHGLKSVKYVKTNKKIIPVCQSWNI